MVHAMVRPYERAPLRGFCCQEYGHVAAVWRGVRRCGRCGQGQRRSLWGECEEDEEEAKCFHCEGSQNAGSAKCPDRREGVKVDKIRAEGRLSRTEHLPPHDKMKGRQNEAQEEEKAL